MKGYVAWFLGLVTGIVTTLLLQQVLQLRDAVTVRVLSQSFGLCAAWVITWLYYRSRVHHGFAHHVAIIAAPIFLVATLRLALHLG